MNTPLQLPDNLPACHALIRQQAAVIDRLQVRVAELETVITQQWAIIAAQQATIARQQAIIEQQQATIEQLRRDVTRLKRQLFGSRRERFVTSPDESPVPNGGIDVDDSEQAPAIPEFFLEPELSVPPRPRTSQGRQRRVIDPAIPRDQVMHRLDENSIPAELLQHPRARRFVRFVREEVEYQPARLRVLEHHQEVLVIDDDADASPFWTATVPPPLLERCFLGAGFLAYLVASRFADHLPYYREEDILARTGFSLHRATQWRCLRSVAQLLQPLITLMRQRTTQSHVLGIDETPCPMLCPGLGRTRSAYLYALYGDADYPYVCFDFAAHKDETNVRRIVGDYQGYLQSDAYICYELIANAAADHIVPVACWAHARRKFEPLIAAGPHPMATWILSQIQKLYDIEDRARSFSNHERHALRQAESRPLVEAIHTWLNERDQHELPRSPLRTGVNYLLKRWPAFERFLENGAIPIDNNRTEAAIKGPVMGKKAWLFLGHENAGQVAATYYTLTMSCKRHQIDVYAYMLDVLKRIRGATPAELEQLLPDRWIHEHPHARLQQRVQESQAAAQRKRCRRARRRAAVPSG